MASVKVTAMRGLPRLAKLSRVVVAMAATGLGGCQDDGPALEERIVGRWVAVDPSAPLVRATVRFAQSKTFVISESYRNRDARRRDIQIQGKYDVVDSDEILLTANDSTLSKEHGTVKIKAGVHFNDDHSMSLSFTRMVRAEGAGPASIPSIRQRVINYIRQ